MRLNRRMIRSTSGWPTSRTLRHEVAVVQQLLRLADERQRAEHPAGEDDAGAERDHEHESRSGSATTGLAEEDDGERGDEQVEGDQVGDEPAAQRHVSIPYFSRRR